VSSGRNHFCIVTAIDSSRPQGQVFRRRTSGDFLGAIPLVRPAKSPRSKAGGPRASRPSRARRYGVGMTAVAWFEYPRAAGRATRARCRNTAVAIRKSGPQRTYPRATGSMLGKQYKAGSASLGKAESLEQLFAQCPRTFPNSVEMYWSKALSKMGR
jgi:hypothetical protein